MPVETEKQSKVELAWAKLVDRFPDEKVLMFDKQPRQIQDLFIQAINHYQIHTDSSVAYLAFTNASRMED